MIRAIVHIRLLLVVLPLVGSLTGSETTALPYSFEMFSVDSGVWEWPAADPHPVVRPYIAPETPYSAGHRGLDMQMVASREVRASADGIVHFAGIVVDRPVLSIRHTDGLISSYEPVTSTLVAGDVVMRGQEVGEVQAGHCLRPCLHFGVRLDGNYVSPLNYLTGIPRAILLPTRDMQRAP
jgi:murein DD-endopeptidase MepM/ murein hydrolase activator NlpD